MNVLALKLANECLNIIDSGLVLLTRNSRCAAHPLVRLPAHLCDENTKDRASNKSISWHLELKLIGVFRP